MSRDQSLNTAVLLTLAEVIECGCKVTAKQLEERNWAWAKHAASVTDDLVQTFARLSADRTPE